MTLKADATDSLNMPAVDHRNRVLINNTEEDGSLRYRLGTYNVEHRPDGGRNISLHASNPADFEWGLVLEVDKEGHPTAMSGSIDLATKVYQGGMIGDISTPINREEGEDRFVIRFKYEFQPMPGVEFNSRHFLVDVTGVKKKFNEPFDPMIGEAGLSRNTLEENPAITQLVLSGIDSLANILNVSAHSNSKQPSVFDLPPKISSSFAQASTELTMFVGLQEARKKIHVP